MKVGRNWNCAATRRIADSIIRSRLPGSYHWFPAEEKEFFCTKDNLDLVPFAITFDSTWKIRSVCVISENFHGKIPRLAALATESGHERCGFGVASVKVALLYIKEVYHGDMFQVHADTYEQDGISAVTFWKKNVMYEAPDPQKKEVGQKLSTAILIEGKINSILSNVAGTEHHGCIIDVGS